MRGMPFLRILLATIVLALSAPLVGAVEPDEVLKDPVLEARARVISAEVRCLVCQNESIDTSNADLARDLRILIRKKLVEGLTNQQIYDFLVARYGAFVLLRPPFKPETWLLWLAPFGIILLGGGGILAMLVRMRRRNARGAPALSAEEERAIEKLIKEEAGGMEA